MVDRVKKIIPNKSAELTAPRLSEQKDSFQNQSPHVATGAAPVLKPKPPKNIHAEFERIFAVGDKITGSTPIKANIVDENGIYDFFQDPRSKAKILIKSQLNEPHSPIGGISVTPRGDYFEIEYGKHPDATEKNIGKNLIFNLEDFSRQIGLDSSKFYAEVSSQSELNMASYLTLLSAGFVPIKRDSGDGIKFVHPRSPLLEDKNTKKLNNIALNYYRYKRDNTGSESGEALNALKEAIANCSPSRLE